MPMLWVILGVIVSVFALGFLGSFALKQSGENAKISQSTQCKDGDLPVIVSVIIDSSDGLDSVQAERSVAGLLRLIERQPTYSRIDVYVARPDGKTLITPIFSKCKPKPPSSGLVSDAEAERKFYNEFRVEVEQAFDKAIALPEARTSPILASTREAVTRSYSRAPYSTRRIVVIVSDMIENSDIANHYRNIGSFDEFQKTSGWSKSMIDLEGAEVHVRYILRPEYRNIQGLAHQEWWRAYFSAVNGHVAPMESY